MVAHKTPAVNMRTILQVTERKAGQTHQHDQHHPGTAVPCGYIRASLPCDSSDDGISLIAAPMRLQRTSTRSSTCHTRALLPKRVSAKVVQRKEGPPAGGNLPVRASRLTEL